MYVAANCQKEEGTSKFFRWGHFLFGCKSWKSSSFLKWYSVGWVVSKKLSKSGGQWTVVRLSRLDTIGGVVKF